MVSNWDQLPDGVIMAAGENWRHLMGLTAKAMQPRQPEPEEMACISWASIERLVARLQRVYNIVEGNRPREALEEIETLGCILEKGDWGAL